MLTFLVHGYHLGVEDGEIYLPGARRLMNPHLYPFAPEFFLVHAKLSIFSHVLAWTSSLTRLSMDWTVLAWYLMTLFATLLGAWMLASACFRSSRAVWCSVLLFASALTMPATNTGLLLMDTYLTSRSFTTPITLIALAFLLEKRYILAGLTICLIATLNLQMVAYLVFLTCLIVFIERRKTQVRRQTPVMASVLLVLPGGFHLSPAAGAYKEALYSRDYFFLYNWTWYHWLGMLAPLAILAWFWRSNLRGTKPHLPG